MESRLGRGSGLRLLWSSASGGRNGREHVSRRPSGAAGASEPGSASVSPSGISNEGTAQEAPRRCRVWRLHGSRKETLFKPPIAHQQRVEADAEAWVTPPPASPASLSSALRRRRKPSASSAVLSALSPAWGHPLPGLGTRCPHLQSPVPHALRTPLQHGAPCPGLPRAHTLLCPSFTLARGCEHQDIRAALCSSCCLSPGRVRIP
uniref:Uncharacterized protein n=1 Tax=Pipistrellus kuhlii TaxID=59472 RepID=A0A7J7R2C2_PIPKU|nr:hypothetical protein mPipKuh1_007991 [Pipistrellus kuhlii]